MVAGRNAMSSSKHTQVLHPSQCSQLSVTYWDADRSTNTFWFPCAIRKSAFLHHYQKILTSPTVRIPLYNRSARELRSLALERSLETIQCVESRLSSPDTRSATSDSVLHAVLALVCYNVSFISGAVTLKSSEKKDAAELMESVYQSGLRLGDDPCKGLADGGCGKRWHRYLRSHPGPDAHDFMV